MCQPACSVTRKIASRALGEGLRTGFALYTGGDKHANLRAECGSVTDGGETYELDLARREVNCESGELGKKQFAKTKRNGRVNGNGRFDGFEWFSGLRLIARKFNNLGKC